MRHYSQNFREENVKIMLLFSWKRQGGTYDK